jgi:hypothetical protein
LSPRPLKRLLCAREYEVASGIQLLGTRWAGALATNSDDLVCLDEHIGGLESHLRVIQQLSAANQ